MLKKISLISLFVFIVLLAGCGHIEQNVIVNSDGSGTVEIIQSFLEDKNIGLDRFIKTEEDYFVKGMELLSLESYKTTKGDGLYSGTKAIYKFNSLSDVKDVKVTNKKNSTIIEVVIQNSEKDEMKGLEALTEGIEINYTMDLPGKVINTNGHLLNEKNVSWDMKKTNPDQGFYVEYETIIKNQTQPVVPTLSNREALALQDIGLLKGTNKGLELDRTLTRAEGAAMINRIYEAIELNFVPITENNTLKWDDVPPWAKEDISKLGMSSVIKGISETKFGPNYEMKAIDYTTMVLRILGHEGSFTWEESLKRAVEIKLLTLEQKVIMENEPFTRNSMAIITYNAIKHTK